jgi:citrate lyase gamma subunit
MPLQTINQWGGIRSGDIIERELDAEIFAYKQQGRKIDYMVGADVLRQCGNQKIWGGDIRSAINEVARRMERRGIQVTRENKRALVDMIYAKTEDPEIEEWKRKLKEEI